MGMKLTYQFSHMMFKRRSSFVIQNNVVQNCHTKSMTSSFWVCKQYCNKHGVSDRSDNQNILLYSKQNFRKPVNKSGDNGKDSKANSKTSNKKITVFKTKIKTRFACRKTSFWGFVRIRPFGDLILLCKLRLTNHI